MKETLDFNVSQNQNVRKIKKQFLSIAFTNMSHVYVHVHVTTAFLIIWHTILYRISLNKC